MSDWLAGWLAGWLAAGWLADWLIGWLARWVDWLVVVWRPGGVMLWESRYEIERETSLVTQTPLCTLGNLSAHIKFYFGFQLIVQSPNNRSEIDPKYGP